MIRISLRSLAYGNTTALAMCLAVLLSLLPATATADDKPTVLRDLVYSQPGKDALKADVYIPAGNGPFPGVLVVHGGAWTIGNKSHMGFASNILAQNGYAVVAINYRLAPQHKFPAQLEDCQAAVRWLRGRAGEFKLDPQRVAGYGYSAGGQLVALLGAKSSASDEPVADPPILSTRLQAVVAGGAPCDFCDIAPESDTLAFWLGGTRKELPAIYESASPVRFVTAKSPPMFFFHGADDQLVDCSEPTAMAKLLTQQGVATELFVLPGKGHLQAMFDTSAVQAAIKFLDRRLKGTVDRE